MSGDYYPSRTCKATEPTFRVLERFLRTSSTSNNWTQRFILVSARTSIVIYYVEAHYGV